MRRRLPAADAPPSAVGRRPLVGGRPAETRVEEGVSEPGSGERVQQIVLLLGLGLFLAGVVITASPGGIGAGLVPWDADEGPQTPAPAGVPGAEPAPVPGGPDADTPREVPVDAQADDEDTSTAADPPFSIVDFDVPDEVREGDVLRIRYAIENDDDSDEGATGEVVLAFDDEELVDDEVTLDPGERMYFEHRIDTSGYDSDGYDVVVGTDAAEETERVRIVEDDDDDDDDEDDEDDGDEDGDDEDEDDEEDDDDEDDDEDDNDEDDSDEDDEDEDDDDDD